MKQFVVYDSAAEAYGIPFYAKSTGEAVRSFSAAAKDPQTNIARHPADFTLFETGTYDELRGIVTSVTHKSLGKAIEYVSQGG